jgi:hypothetical protein
MSNDLFMHTNIVIEKNYDNIYIDIRVHKFTQSASTWAYVEELRKIYLYPFILNDPTQETTIRHILTFLWLG